MRSQGFYFTDRVHGNEIRYMRTTSDLLLSLFENRPANGHSCSKHIPIFLTSLFFKLEQTEVDPKQKLGQMLVLDQFQKACSTFSTVNKV